MRGVDFRIGISPRIRSQNRNGLKGSVRDLGQSDLCKNIEKTGSLPCPFNNGSCKLCFVMQPLQDRYSVGNTVALWFVDEDHACPETEFMDEIHIKVFRVFLLAIFSHLHSFAFRFLFFQSYATSYSFQSSVTVHCKEERRKS